MPIPFFKLLQKRFLGVDIGTSHIRIAEVSKFGHQKKLESYGEVSGSIFYEKSFRTFEKNTLVLSDQEVARAIMATMEEAGTKTKKAIFSIPDFSTFFTSFKLPPMTEEELPEAVKYEAKQHTPLPLSEVVLDWQIIEKKPLDKKRTLFKILLVAVPVEVVNQYQEIAKIANLEPIALEAEVFSLVRALITGSEEGPVALIDIGAQSTTCSIVDKKILKASHSFDMSGDDLLSTLARALNIEFTEAKELKSKYGIEGKNDQIKENGQTVKEILLPLVDIILREIKGILNDFEEQEKTEIKKVIVAGGTALLPGLKEYFTKSLKIETEVANPFAHIFYPTVLEKTLIKAGPSFAIAVGSALRGLE